MQISLLVDSLAPTAILNIIIFWIGAKLSSHFNNMAVGAIFKFLNILN